MGFHFGAEPHLSRGSRFFSWTRWDGDRLRRPRGPVLLEGDREFESLSLQRRVRLSRGRGLCRSRRAPAHARGRSRQSGASPANRRAPPLPPAVALKPRRLQCQLLHRPPTCAQQGRGWWCANDRRNGFGLRGRADCGSDRGQRRDSRGWQLRRSTVGVAGLVAYRGDHTGAARDFCGGFLFAAFEAAVETKPCPGFGKLVPAPTIWHSVFPRLCRLQ